MAENEVFSFKKLGKGFVTARNGAKALVLLWWIAIILGVGFCVWFTVSKMRSTGLKQVQKQEQVISNSGQLTDSHNTLTEDNRKEKGANSLISLFNINTK